jgi:hypothetical protein
MNNENDSWEIAIDTNGEEDVTVKQLPHIIRVRGFNFIPIHDFAPQLQSHGINGDSITTYGDQRFISLANKTGDNWDMSQYPLGKTF